MNAEQVQKIILGNMTEAVCVCDMSHNILYINPATARLTGWSLGEAKKKKCYEIFGDENQSCKNNCLGDRVISKKLSILHHEGKLKTRTGKIKDVQISVSPIPEEKGEEISRIVILLKDVTPFRDIQETYSKTLIKLEKEINIRKNVEEELRKKINELKRAEELLQKQKEEIALYLDILTHDLKGYHLVAGSYLDIIQTTSPSSEIADFLAKSSSGLALATSLVNNISILMRRKLPYSYELEPASLSETLKKAKETLEELFPEKEIEIVTTNVTAKSIVLADSLFGQLLLNLLSNAVKNDPHEVIKIEIAFEDKQNGTCLLTIGDNGKGIPPEQREGIFERFSEFRKKGKGSGLGLFIIKTLVDRYKGKVWIESRISEDYTQGTKFKIELRTA